MAESRLLERPDTSAPPAGRPAGPASQPSGRPSGQPAAPPAGPGRRRARRVAGAACTVAGGLLLLFVAYLTYFTGLQEVRAQHRLAADLLARGALEGRVAEGAPAGVISVPALHLDAVVVKGSSPADLESGPGLVPGSAPGGAAGNTVIAGRRVSFGHPFGSLDRLRPGDLVVYTDGSGRHRYRVKRTWRVRPGQPDPTGPSSDARLTLVTSDPPLAATGHLVAVALLQGHPLSARPGPVAAGQRSQLGLTGDSSAAVGALLWAQAFLAALGLTVAAYRRWGQVWPTYLISTPVLVALALLAFGSVARLLPATL
ncbi:MAG TPA: class E sortase [Acidimicrobiales bacterium]|nr:class E sortase [Acidimicrobiales bacterium]